MSRHEFDAADVDELLGAFALDACEPEEVAAIERHLAGNPTLAAEAEQLRNAAVWIGAADALEAPAALRQTVLEVARSRRPSAGADPVLDLYTGQTGALGTVIDGLSDDDLDLPTTNGLSVRDLVIHCAAQESLAAQLVGRPTVAEVTETEIDARTAALIAHYRDRPLADARALWAASVAALQAWAADPAHRDRTIRWLGGDIPRADVVTIRAFESWIHADDLRRACRRRTEAPAPGHLAVMSDLSGRTSGFGLMMVGRSRPGKTARLVLTGAGGGDWLIAMGGGEVATTPDVTVTADVVDWCLLAGDRISPAELDCGILGDRDLAEDLLVAASAFATL